MDIRRSSATSRNARLEEIAAPAGGNAAWLARRAQPGAVVFFGGASLTDFRIRVAQSQLRHDMLPSFWSVAGVATSAHEMLTVPLAPAGDAALVPATNGVRAVRFTAFDDAAKYPNVASIRFADPSDVIVTNAKRLIGQRSVVDLISMLLPWLGFVWGAGTKRNPLLDDVGLPDAAFVETAFGMAGIELTPGLSSGSSCPEAIWQSALWWHDYYERSAPVPMESPRAARAGSGPRVIVPEGAYRILQRAAAVTWEGEPRSTSTSRARRTRSRGRRS